MAPPVVFADANVLYSSALRDLLMQLAVDGTIILRWSDAVQDEWTTAVLRDRPVRLCPGTAYRNLRGSLRACSIRDASALLDR